MCVVDDLCAVFHALMLLRVAFEVFVRLEIAVSRRHTPFAFVEKAGLAGGACSAAAHRPDGHAALCQYLLGQKHQSDATYDDNG